MKEEGNVDLNQLSEQGLSSRCLFLLLIVAAAIFIRLPYFSQLTVNWDETTFIIMGQDILNGNLPYTNLWDLKPPLGFAIFSMFVSVAGDNIVVIRALGAVYLGLAAFFLYLSLITVVNKSYSLLGALLFLTLISILTLQQSIYTEHLLLLPVAICLWLFSFEQLKGLHYFYAGVLIGIACFIRLNLAFIAPALCLYVLFSPGIVTFKEKLSAAVFISIGFWLVVLLTAIPYLISGEFGVFWRSVFEGPLSYSNAEMNVLQTLIRQAGNLLKHNASFSITSSVLNAFLYVPVCWGLWKFLSCYPKIKDNNRRLFEVSLILLLAVELSILIGGRMNDHYIIQLTPMLIVFFAYGMFNFYQAWGEYSLSKGRLDNKKKNGILLAAFVVCLFYMSQNYAVFGYNNDIAKPTGELCSVEYLASRLQPEDKLYVLTGHIIYWLLDKDPIRPSVTHPSTITRPYLFPFIPGAKNSPEAELLAIMDQNPAYIVKEAQTWYFDDAIGLEEIFDRQLAANYTMVKQCDAYFIYERVDR